MFASAPMIKTWSGNGGAFTPTLDSYSRKFRFGSSIPIGVVDGTVYAWSETLGRYVAQSDATPFPLAKLARKIANQRSGASTANIKLCFDGDSHTAGVGCGSGGGSYNLNNAAPYTHSAIVGRLLAAQGFNVYSDAWFGAKGTGIALNAYDPRFALTGTWMRDRSSARLSGPGVRDRHRRRNNGVHAKRSMGHL